MLKSRQPRHSDRSSSRLNAGSYLFNDDEYKNDSNIIYNDDSKFARQLKKLMKDEENEKKIPKFIDLSTYLDQNENIKFIIKLGKPSLNILLKIATEKCQTEIKDNVVECIGKIGAVMIRESDSKYIEWIFDKLKVNSNDSRDITKDDQIKLILIESLKKSLSMDYILNLVREHVPSMLNSLKQLLESFDNSNLMINITKSILFISKKYFSETLVIFEDVVDILVAWHIDCTQPEDVIDFTSRALIDLRPYWLKKMNFTLILLNQFIEDLESYMNSCFEDEKNPLFDDKLDKMSALIRVYNTVLRAISSTDPKLLKHTPNDNEKEHLMASIRKLMECVMRIGTHTLNEVILCPSNQSIELMFDLFGDSLAQHQTLISHFLLLQNSSKQTWSFEHDLCFLRLISKLSQILIAQNNVEFFKGLVVIGMRLWSIKLSSKSTLVQECLQLFKFLIGIKSIPIVQEIYMSLLTDFELAMKKLCPESDIKINDVNLVMQELDFDRAQSIILFNLSVFTELGSAKNHLICMYALSPSLFELLTHKISPCLLALSETYPNIQYALINTLYSHCSRHDNFFRNSSLIHKSNSDTAMFMNSQTRDHFKCIIQIHSEVLSHQASLFEIFNYNWYPEVDPVLANFNLLYRYADLLNKFSKKETLILKWLNDIFDVITVDLSFIFDLKVLKNLFHSIIDATYSNEEEVCLNANRLLLKILQKFIKLPDEILVCLLDSCKYHMMSLNETIQEDFTKLMAHLPVNILSSKHLDLSVLTKKDFSVFSKLARLNYISSSTNPSAFGIHHFKLILNYLLTGQAPSSNDDHTWLQRLFYSCQRNDCNKQQLKQGEISLESVIENHDGLLWFWALFELSQFCVHSKLKTPLGKPQDLFIAIESTIKSYANNTSLEDETTSRASWSSDLTRVTLLVQFLEYLEKSIYNAYEGTATSIPLINNKAVKYFFKTNKQTCIDWFTRVRSHIIQLSVKSGHYEIAIRQSYEYLSQSNVAIDTIEFKQVVVHLVKSLIKLKQWQCLHGLKEFLGKISKTQNFDWINGAIQEAQGKVEMALYSYKQSSSLNDSFTNERIIACFNELHDWKEYLSWLEISKPASENIKQEVDFNYIKALSSYESFDFELCKSFARKMSSFQSIYDLAASITPSWHAELLEEATRKEIFKTLVFRRSNYNSIDISQKISSDLLKILSIDEASVWNSDRVVLTQLTYLSKNDAHMIPFVKSIKFNAYKHNVRPLNDFLAYCQYNRQYSEDFIVAFSRLARKQCNFKLAERLLNRLLRLGNNSNLSIVELLDLFSEKSSNRVLFMEIENEVAKLFYAKDNTSLLPLEILAKSISSYFNQKPTDETSERCARSIIKLTKWLGSSSDCLKNINEYLIEGATDVANDETHRLCLEIQKIFAVKSHGLSEKTNLSPDNSAQIKSESLIGELLDLATIVHPRLIKSWSVIGDWSYKLSKKQVDKSESNVLDEEVLNLILNGLPIDLPENERDYVLSILSNKDEGFEQNNDLRALLSRNCKSLSNNDIERTLDTYKSVTSRLYYYHKIACKSYFTYLSLNENDKEGNVHSTLRILKILVKHSRELKDDLHKALLTTPTQPWTSIIAQLFSRLNYPNEFVRQSITQLLGRIARNYPHLIVYPAVVGSTDGPTEIETSNNNEKNLFESESEMAIDLQVCEIDECVDESKEQEKQELKNAYVQLLNTLGESNNQMISEVKLFIGEMRRITLLREELWLGTLNQIHLDVTKRIEQLTSEMTKTNQNLGLSEEERQKIMREKYEILLAPVINVVECVYQITCLPAATPNELNFENEFSNRIEVALKQLKNSNNATQPSNAWSQFKQIHHLMYQRSQRKSFNTLYLDQISPKLATLKSSKIPIPGVTDCTLQSIASTIHILPTKTKPKKLFFIGSNGKKYPFLFKGLEDLHLDERIMQLLSIINTMFDKTNKSEYPHYHACNYSVTPLGPRSGLISWVENSTPLFSLYKKWLQRELTHLQNKLTLSNIKPDQSLPTQIQRPSEIYTNKLNAILKEQKIAITGLRSDYPVSVLKQALEELIRETPNDLLSKEIWCGAATPGSWFQNIQVYSRSSAVMSIIGYIIGLGDRHLDNLLINIQSGEIAHIDYNICFEKGKNLKIPEKIPFRLTQNLVHALGLTGIDGTFRLSCEQVMSVLRKGRETLLTLMETFIYDPLLDWTSNDSGIIASFYGGGNCTHIQNSLDRKKMDKELTYKLLSLRLAENRVFLQKLSEKFSNFLLQLSVKVTSLIDLTDQLTQKDALVTIYEQAKLYLEEAMKTKQHLIYTLHDRAVKFLSYNSNFEEFAKTCQDYTLDCEKSIDNYNKALSITKSNELRNKIEFINEQSSYESKDSPFKVAIEFLDSIGQAANVTQCKEIENELINAHQNQKIHLKIVIECLNSYSKVLNWLPNDFWSQSSKQKLVHWLKNLTKSNFSHAAYDQVIKEIAKNEEINVLANDATLKNEIKMQASRITLLESRKTLSEEEFKSQFDFLKDSLLVQIAEKYQYLPQTIDTCVCIIIQMLASNLYKWNLMESASIQAKEHLVSLSSKDGDWYLDEMSSLIGNTNHLSQLLNEMFILYGLQERFFVFHMCCDAFINLNNTFTNLKLILVSYGQNIFEKLINLALTKSSDMDSCLNDFKKFEIDAFYELTHHNFLNNTECNRMLNDMRQNYNLMLKNKSNKVSCVLNQMDKLFLKVDLEFDKCMKVLRNCIATYGEIPAFSHLTYLLDDSYYTMCKHIFTVKKYQSMNMCLSEIARFRDSFYEPTKSIQTSEDFFVLSLKSYISDFVIQMLVGIPTLIISYLIMSLKEDLNVDLSIQAINCCVNEKIHFYSISEYELNTLNHIISDYDSIWSSMDLFLRINSNKKYVESFKNTLEHVSCAFEWFYDPHLLNRDSNRESFMNELENFNGKIDTLEETFESCLNKLNNYELSILKRLEWNAGSMPSMHETIKLFEQKRKTRNEYFKVNKENLYEINKNLKILKEFEMTRDKANECDEKFDEFLKSIKNSQLLDYDHSNDLSEVEMAIYNFKSFKDSKSLTIKMIQEYLKSLIDEIFNLKRIKSKEDLECLEKMDDLSNCNNDLKQILNQHNKVMNDIKPLLKIINKYGLNARLHDYTKMYQKFSENCQILLKFLSTSDRDSSKLKEIKESTFELIDVSARIYSDLNELNNCKNEGNSTDKSKTQTSLKNQQANSYASSVWKRINQKLSGKDPDNNKVMSVEEQVDYLIEEAIDLENLATLYEGWTPWV